VEGRPNERMMPKFAWIIPGDWGKVESGWLAQPLKKPSQGGESEAEFTSSSGGVRAPSVNAKKGLSGKERGETVPSRVK